MIESVIFDMDGLLIDSEPLWQEAEIKSFKNLGIILNSKMCLQTMGMRIDQVVDYWSCRFIGKINNKKFLAQDIISEVILLINKRGKPKEGVFEILEFMRNKKIKIALASSSQFILIETVVKKLGIKKYFHEIYSAEMEEYGKPHPGVYITTAKKLRTPPEKCLAFEDSFNGLLSAKAARIKCVCIPDKSIEKNLKLSISDLVLNSLKDFNEKDWTYLNKKNK